MPNRNPAEVEYAWHVARLNEVLRGINLCSIEAIADSSKRETLASDNARMWLEADTIKSNLWIAAVLWQRRTLFDVGHRVANKMAVLR